MQYETHDTPGSFCLTVYAPGTSVYCVRLHPNSGGVPEMGPPSELSKPLILTILEWVRPNPEISEADTDNHTKDSFLTRLSGH